jgi:hypothetical protein
MPVTPTPRVTPGGIKLDDGYSTKITFAADTDVSLWEKTVKPPGIDGGDAIDTTTMHNTTYRTMASRALKTLTESSVKCAYDPDLYNQILALVNNETAITVTFPDGSTLAFWGYLRTFEPDDLTEGSQPEATVNISPTNVNPTTRAEEGPVLTSVAGT